MEKLCDIDIYALDVKIGDIKVDSTELKMLFECLEAYHSILCNALETLSDDERKELDKGLVLTEYMQNKYIVLGNYRLKQKQMYDLLQKFRDANFTKDSSAEEVEKANRTVWGFYLEEKGKRESLERELINEREKVFELFYK